MIVRLLIFLGLNFGALALGGLFTSKGVSSDWYQQLNKAPWTPPGWFFGLAWTTIMLCFSYYMAVLWNKSGNKELLLALFVLQWLLNVAWNPLFFYWHNVWLALIVISLLTALVIFIFYTYYKTLGGPSFLILPYAVWLLVATSLNLYIGLKN